jgi:hypothetical protein
MRRRGPKITHELIVHYKDEARQARWQAYRDASEWLSLRAIKLARYVITLFALLRRKCSSSRGRISTKLQGRYR